MITKGPQLISKTNIPLLIPRWWRLCTDILWNPSITETIGNKNFAKSLNETSWWQRHISELFIDLRVSLFSRRKCSRSKSNWAILPRHVLQQTPHKWALSVFVVKLYSFSLSIAYVAHRRHPYIESLPTLWLCRTLQEWLSIHIYTTNTHTHTPAQVYHEPGAMTACDSSLCGECQCCPLHALQLHGCPSTCSHTGGQIHDVQVGTQGRCGSLYVPELEVTHTHTHTHTHMHTHTHTHTHTHSHAHTLTHTHSHTHTLFCY